MHSTPPTPAAPTTQQIREAIGVIQIAVRDPYADPVAVEAAHRMLVAGSRHVNTPVREWLNEYLGGSSTAGGAVAFCTAIDTLAQHFKIPAPDPPVAPGQQARLFG